MSASLLSVTELSTHIDSENGLVRALDRVSFDVSAGETFALLGDCLLYTSPSPRDRTRSRMPSSA